MQREASNDTRHVFDTAMVRIARIALFVMATTSACAAAPDDGGGGGEAATAVRLQPVATGLIGARSVAVQDGGGVYWIAGSPSGSGEVVMVATRDGDGRVGAPRVLFQEPNIDSMAVAADGIVYIAYDGAPSHGQNFRVARRELDGSNYRPLHTDGNPLSQVALDRWPTAATRGQVYFLRSEAHTDGAVHQVNEDAVWHVARDGSGTAARLFGLADQRDATTRTHSDGTDDYATAFAVTTGSVVWADSQDYDPGVYVAVRSADPSAVASSLRETSALPVSELAAFGSTVFWVQRADSPTSDGPSIEAWDLQADMHWTVLAASGGSNAIGNLVATADRVYFGHTRQVAIDASVPNETSIASVSSRGTGSAPTVRDASAVQRVLVLSAPPSATDGSALTSGLGLDGASLWCLAGNGMGQLGERLYNVPLSALR